MTKTETFNKAYTKTNIPPIRTGDTVRVYQKIKEADPSNTSGQVKERVQIFEGLVLAQKHGKGLQGMLMVRKITQGVGVERIFPIHSPLIDKIEIVKSAKVRRAKLYYLREAKGKKGKLKAKEMGIAKQEQESPVAENPAEATEEKGQ